MKTTTKTFIQELARVGVPSNLLNQLAQNIDQNTNADNLIDNRLMTRDTFNKYTSDINTLVEKKVNEKLTSLAVLKDILPTLKQDSDAFKKAVDQIKELEDTLINKENYDKDQVKNLTLKTREGLEILNKLSGLDLNINTEDIVKDIDLTGVNNMPDKSKSNDTNDEDYIKVNDPRLQETFASMALGATNVQGKINQALFQYHSLHGKFPDDVATFTKKVTDNFAKGIDVDETAEEHYKFSETIKANNEKELNDKLEAAKKEGEVELEKKLRAQGINVDKVKLKTGEGHKRHISNIISDRYETSSPDEDLDNKLNAGGNGKGGDEGLNNKTKLTRNEEEFKIPIRPEIIGTDGSLPYERRAGFARSAMFRPQRVEKTKEYVERKGIDLTAD
jgi:hypothetical protein